MEKVQQNWQKGNQPQDRGSGKGSDTWEAFFFSAARCRAEIWESLSSSRLYTPGSWCALGSKGQPVAAL